jgi:hypothetical protein
MVKFPTQPQQRPHRQVGIHESTSHLSCAVATGHRLYNHPIVSFPSFQLLRIDWLSRVVSLGLCILTASS